MRKTPSGPVNDAGTFPFWRHSSTPATKGTDPHPSSGHNCATAAGDTTEAITSTLQPRGHHRQHRRTQTQPQRNLSIARQAAHGPNGGRARHESPTNPTRPNPTGPSSRRGHMAPACINKITITSINTLCGDNCPSQLTGVAGNKGNSTKARADNNKPSCNPGSVNQWVANR